LLQFPPRQLLLQPLQLQPAQVRPPQHHWRARRAWPLRQVRWMARRRPQGLCCQAHHALQLPLPLHAPLPQCRHPHPPLMLLLLLLLLLL
jgi:hypothetical protein